MKKKTAILLCAVCLVTLLGCQKASEPTETLASEERDYSAAAEHETTTEGAERSNSPQDSREDVTTLQPSADSTSVDTPIWGFASYQDFLDQAAETSPSAMFALFDMDADDEPEVILKTGSSKASSRYEIYGIKNGEAICYGSIDGIDTKLYPVSRYYALICLTVNEAQNFLRVSLLVFDNGAVTDIESYNGEIIDGYGGYEELEFTPLRKRNDVSWNGNPSEINEWLFNQFLEQHWSYNMIDELRDNGSLYDINFRASLPMQMGIEVYETATLDELLLFAIGYEMVNDPTNVDVFMKDGKLRHAISTQTANEVLLDFFGLQPDYSMLSPTGDVFLSGDTIYYRTYDESHWPYIAIANDICDNNDRTFSVQFDIYRVSSTLSWYDYDQFYAMTAAEAANQNDLIWIGTGNEVLYQYGADAEQLGEGVITSYGIFLQQ